MNLWKTALVLAVVAAFGLGVVSAYAQPNKPEEPKKPAEPVKEPPKVADKPMCPVMGMPVDFCVMTMAEDGPVYFCCKDCPEKFKADPKKYAEKVAAQRKVLAKMPRVQVTCPMTGKPVDKTVFAEIDGVKVFFSAKDEIEKYKKDAPKMKGKLEGCYTYQTKCPVSSKDIDPAAFIAAKNGVKVYFCCKDCPAKFEKEVGKYLPELKKLGYNFKAEDFKAAPAKPEEKKPEAKPEVKKPEAKPVTPPKPEEKKPEEKKPDKKG